MTPKEKALEMVRGNFDVLAKATKYKGLKKEGEKKFYAIEKIAKECAIIGVDSFLKVTSELKVDKIIDSHVIQYWNDVKTEINNL